MRIRRWHCYIVFNCALIIPGLFGKPVSLNALIAAENQKKQITTESTSKPIVKRLVGKPVSLNAIIAAENQKKHASNSTTGWIKKETVDNQLELNEDSHKFIKTKDIRTRNISLIKQLSSLKDKRSDIIGIKRRLKPQELLKQLRKKRKIKSNKLGILKNENSDSEYTPLLRNLNKLFDKVFNNHGSAANKIRKGKPNHSKIVAERNGMVCTCQQKSAQKQSAPLVKSPKKTTAYAETVSIEVATNSETAAETATDTAMADIRSIGSNKNLSLLLSRNSVGSRRNHNGHSKRSSSAFYGDFKRNITGNHGDSKYNSGIRANESNSESYEKDTNGFARNSSSSYGFGRDGNDTRSSDDREATDEDIKFEENEDINSRFSKDFDEQIKFQIGRNKTGSEISLSEYDGGSRGHVPQDQIDNNTIQPIQPKEDHEKSNDNVTLDCANDQRIFDGSGSVTTEIEDVSSENITVISIKDLSNLTLALQSAPKGNLPVVTIFGGYSVAKDINGQNKLSEQSIHIHS